MTKITIDVADFGGVTHRGDHVIFNSPMFHPRAGSTTSIVSPAPRRIPLKDGKAVVADVAPGVLEVRFRVKNLVDTAPFKVMVPDVDEISLRTLLVDEFENTPVVVSTLQALITSFNKNMDKREQGLQITLTQAKQAEQGAQTHAREAERQAREAAGSATKAGDFKTQAQQAANRAETSEEHTRSLEMSAGKSAQTAKQSAADTQADRAVIAGYHTAVSGMVTEVEKDRAEVATNTGTVAENTKQVGEYAKQAETSKVAAEKAAVNAEGSERAAKTAEDNAAGSATTAEGFKNSAENAATKAGEHETGAGKYEANAGKSAQVAKQSEVNAGKHAKTAQTQRELTENAVSNFSPTVTKVENLTAETKGYRDQAETYAKQAIIGVKPDSVTEGMLTTEVRKKLDGKLDKTLVSDSSTAPQGTIVQRGKDGRVPTRLTPTFNDEAASKQYVDQRVNTKANSSHKHVSTDITDRVAAAGGTAGAYKIVTTYADGYVHAVSDPTLPDHLTRKSWVDAQINNVKANAEVDGRNKAGGKLVKWDNGGRIQLPNPVGDANPVTLGYLNDKLNKKVDKSQVAEAVTKQGDIVARSAGGNISVPLSPGNDYAATSRHYVTAMSDNLFTDPKFRDDCWGGWANNNYGGCLTILANGTQTGLYYSPAGQGGKSLVLEPGEKYVVRAKVRFGGNSNIQAFSMHLTGAKGYIGLPCEFRRNSDTNYNIGWVTETFIAPDKLKETNGECSPGFYVERNYTAGEVTIIEVHINRCLTPNDLNIDETTATIGSGSNSANKVVKTGNDGQIIIHTNSITRPGHVANKEYVDSGLSKKVDVSRVGQTVGAQGQIVARTQGGNITVPDNPGGDNHAVSKKYVDNELQKKAEQTQQSAYVMDNNMRYQAVTEIIPIITQIVNASLKQIVPYTGGLVFYHTPSKTFHPYWVNNFLEMRGSGDKRRLHVNAHGVKEGETFYYLTAGGNLATIDHRGFHVGEATADSIPFKEGGISLFGDAELIGTLSALNPQVQIPITLVGSDGSGQQTIVSTYWG